MFPAIKRIRKGDYIITYHLMKICGANKHDDGYRYVQVGPPERVEE